jgi:hypothetical protein
MPERARQMFPWSAQFADVAPSLPSHWRGNGRMRTLKLTQLSKQFANPKGAAPRAVGARNSSRDSWSGSGGGSPGSGAWWAAAPSRQHRWLLLDSKTCYYITF